MDILHLNNIQNVLDEYVSKNAVAGVNVLIYKDFLFWNNTNKRF